MKKKLLLVLCAILSLSAFAAKPVFYPGTVRYKGGETATYAGIAMPKPYAIELLVTNDPKHKEREKLPMEDIFSIALWHPDHPEEIGYLYPLTITQNNGTKIRICLLEEISEWGAVLAMADAYAVNGTTGELYGLVRSSNYSVPMLSHYLLKKGEENAVLLYVNRTWTPRKSAAAQHFAENPEIADGITSGKLKTTDIAYILDAMAMSTGVGTASTDRKPAGNNGGSASGKQDTPSGKGNNANTRATSSRKNSTFGVDNTYGPWNDFRVSYTNFLSSNQSFEARYEASMSVFRLGFQIGGRWEQTYDIEKNYDYENQRELPADTTLTNKAELLLGLLAGFQVPVQVGKYYLIPHVYAQFNLTPLSWGESFDNGYATGPFFTVPLNAGIDFVVPVGADYSFNVGLHYVYDFAFHDNINYVLTNQNSASHRPVISEGTHLSCIGQSGLGVSVAFCW